MKILFISPSPVFGGASTATISVASLLKENGVEVIYNDEYDRESIRGSLQVDHYPYHQNRFSSHKKIRDHIRSIYPNFVIWSQLAAIYYYKDIRILQKEGIKQLSIIHSLSLSQDLKGRVMDFLVARVLNRLDATIFVSNYTLKSWLKYSSVKNGAGKKAVIYNAVRTSQHNQNNNNKKVIGFVGRFSKEKKPELFCSLTNFITDYFLFHAWGNGPLLDICKRKYPQVVFHGQETDINHIYSNIGVLVLTSSFENCPMVILEAKVRGIPCVAPNVGGIPEIVSDGVDGILFDSYEPTSILKAVEKVVNNYESFSNNCVKNSSAFIFDEIFKEWFSLLNNL